MVFTQYSDKIQILVMIEKYSYCRQKQCITFYCMLYFQCYIFLCFIVILSFIMQTHETHKPRKHSLYGSLIKEENRIPHLKWKFITHNWALNYLSFIRKKCSCSGLLTLQQYLSMQVVYPLKIFMQGIGLEWRLNRSFVIE